MKRIKVFTDPAFTRDALPDLAIGEVQLEAHGDCLLAIRATTEIGCDTGRRRYRVVCRVCRIVVHPATTGPRQMIENHQRAMREFGGDQPYPGETYP